MKRKKGFTLIEIVIALAVISIMMVPLASSLLTSVKANKKAEIAQESKLISQEIIEKLRTLGDVKATPSTSKGISVGKNGEYVRINNLSESIGEKEKWGINGEVDGILVNGTIIKKQEVGELEDSSDRYAKESVDLLIYIDDKEMKYSYGTKTIENHIESKDFNMINSLNELKIVFDEKNKVEIKNDVDLSEKIAGKVAIYIKTPRKDDNKIELYIDKVDKFKFIDDNINVYIIGNKFNDHIQNEDSNVERYELSDSFKKDRFIGSKINVVDNIKYYEVESRKNKGLYTIELNLEKGAVKEKTVSEFMVSN